MVVKVVDRASGAELDVVQAGGVVELSGASDVHLGLNVGSVESLVRIGDDLVVTSSGGGTTVLGGFFGGVGNVQDSRIFVDGSNEVTGTERRGDDVIVRLEHGAMLVIENYYNQDTNTGEAPAADEAVLLPDGSEEVPPWLQRWSEKIGPEFKVGPVTKEMIQNGQEKEPLAMLVIENYYNQDTNTGEAPVADEAVPPWLQRWSEKIGPEFKVGPVTKETIQNG